jgi:hypothetical protein
MAHNEWATTPGDRPACPNNSRHPELQQDPRGGLICLVCQEEHAGSRSREAHRWADPR